jgi:hypothetical protein
MNDDGGVEDYHGRGRGTVDNWWSWGAGSSWDNAAVSANSA